ncbi:MAG: glycosyltransferase family 2 protein [Cyclobacteriaceae bacterium]
MKINSYFHKTLRNYARYYCLQNEKLIEVIGSGKGSVKPDAHIARVEVKGRITDDALLKIEGVPSRIILLNGIVHELDDIQNDLEELKTRLHADHRVLIVYYSKLWRPLVKLAAFLGMTSRPSSDNWVTHADINNLCKLSGFELIKSDKKVIVPIWIPLLSGFFNKFLVNLPIYRHLAMANIALIRPIFPKNINSVTIVVPARNESGNIDDILRRIPKMSDHDEVIFVEGNSTDDTWDKIQSVQGKSYPFELSCYQQPGKGKADAVRVGFGHAKGDILMILDADMTVPPEELPKFYRAITSGLGEYINGSRMIYPMESKAMRFFNILGNRFFAAAFSYVLGERFRDTLCGTKVMTRSHYNQLISNRSYFGEFDPFGDFDLIFGANKLGLKTIEVPIRYRDRLYGSTNISRWKHGVILLRMLIFASRKIKFK